MLTLEFVKDIVNSDLDPRIEAARAMSAKLRLHVDGVGLQTYLEKINNYENADQFKARQKHAISNKFLTEDLLRPTDNAFNARGGSKNYKFKTEDKKNEEAFVNKLINVRDHASLSDYVKNVWFPKYITDPNGLILTEVTSHKGGIELLEDEKTAEPCYKSIDSIRAYEQDGIFVKWVIFEPHRIIKDADKPEEKAKQIDIFWAVDSEFYYLYKKTDEGIELIGEPIENSFERVPAILCSNITDNVTGWKKSAIDSQVELLDKYVVDNSVLNITQFFHNYPLPWEYVDNCSSCNGLGTAGNTNEICPKCNGTKKNTRKDVTDKIELKIPTGDSVKIDPPAGYITTPVEAMNEQVTLIDRLKNIIFFSQWGANHERGKNETATGRFLDVQPVNNRLDNYSTSIEIAHTALANFLGQFYFPETFDKAFIQYGRRYLLETPDQIWEKYIKAKTDSAPVTTLDLLLSQFLESEFRENERMFRYEMKKVKLEPFVHWDVELVQKLNVDPNDYKKKLYFSEWILTKDFSDVVKTELKVLQTELTTFVATKTINANINLKNNQNE